MEAAGRNTRKNLGPGTFLVSIFLTCFRTSIVGGTGGTGFVQDERMNDPSVDWMNSKESRQEFFNNLEQQYTYFCYGKG